MGQEQGKRALEITAAGGHNLLLIGPPGTGKTMLASRLSGLLPPLNNHEALESAAIYSLDQFYIVAKQWRRRPFRSPHHSASLTAMVGGGSIPGPVRSHWHTMAFCFLMNCLSLSAGCWMHCENPLNQVRYISHAREPK
jgi:predicted ATPase with chaperone activity